MTALSDTTLSDNERRAIEWDCARLINLYAALNDAAQWEDVAALYVENGIMTRPSAPDVEIVGRTAILAAFTARPPRKTRHICGNIVIVAESATAARGTSAMLLFTGQPAPLVGGFTDRFALTADGWRFAERRGTLDFGP